MNPFRPASLFAEGETVLPRFRYLGDLTLDLLHQDGRIADRWLELQPDEFAALWHLARQPGKCLPALARGAQATNRQDEEQAELARVLDNAFAKLVAHGLGEALIHRPGGCACWRLRPA